MATAPAGIAEDVDVGGPDGQTLENVAVAVGAAHIVLAASLNADSVADLLHHVLVKGGGHADGLGEDGGSARAADTVDALAPPVVSGDAQTLDRGSPAQHLADLLVQGHLRNEVGRTLAVLSLFSGILGSLHNAFSCSSVSFTERRNLNGEYFVRARLLHLDFDVVPLRGFFL